MAKAKVIEVLQAAAARELAAITQYMWQHVITVGLESGGIKDIFKDVAIAEMKHAETFAERLDFFDEVPTTKPTKITVNQDLKQMLRDDIEIEKGAIEMYKKAIDICKDDPGTRHLFEDILLDEEGHLNEWTSLLNE
jgi:bacterioferritin